MKNKILYKLVVVAMIFIVATSCEKWIDTDLNNDPNNPETTLYNAILPTIQADLAYQVGGDLSRPVCIWMQQYSGYSNQMIAYDVYNYTQSDVNNVWQWGMYAGAMVDLHRMIKQAEADKSYHYLGIAEVLMAYSLGTMTDLFGDIPYSKAFDENDLTPEFDSQESIYTSINTLLDNAITHLVATTSLFSPGSDDLMYGGNLDMWTRAANTLKARYALHLSKLNGATAYNNALTALANGFTSNSDNLQLAFGEKNNEWGPAFQYFYYDRYGDCVMGKFFVDTLRNDPRFDLYVDTTGASEDPGMGEGSNPGLADGYANPGSYYHSPASIVPLITYPEAKFIEAEALLMTLDSAGAAAAYNEAVTNALDMVGVTDAAWLAANANETATSITLGKIITQKYIALYTQPEIYVDYRRTGYPQLTPAVDAATLDKQIPRRWPYPTSEKDYNSANFEKYKNVTISTPLWWDK